MGIGFQVFDGSGNLIVAETDRLTRFIGTVYTGTNDGSIGIPEFAAGYPGWYSMMPIGSAIAGLGFVAPRVTIVSNGILWNFDGTPGAFRRPGYITYGCY